MRHAAFFCLGLSALVAAPATARDEETPVPIGVAVVDITPETPIRMTGYGNRKTESEGVESRLKGKALAIGGDDEGAAVLLAVDNLGVPAHVTEEVAARLKAKAGLPRERFVLCSTHTHCGPALSGSLGYIFGGPIPADQQARIDRYTRSLTDALEE